MTASEIVPSGDLQEVNAARQVHGRTRHDAAYEYAVKSQTHMWVVVVRHLATDALLNSTDGVVGDPAILDADTMLGPPAIGCYVCEQVYEPRLRLRKCRRRTRRRAMSAPGVVVHLVRQGRYPHPVVRDGGAPVRQSQRLNEVSCGICLGQAGDFLQSIGDRS